MNNWFTTYKDVISPVLSVLLFGVGYLIQSRARKIQKFLLWKEYREPLIEFADQSIAVFSQVESLCEKSVIDKELLIKDNRNSLLEKISALRDCGKLRLPNRDPDAYGEWKSSAFRGFRHESLDCLACLSKLVIAFNYRKNIYNRVKFNLVAFLRRVPPNKEGKFPIDPKRYPRTYQASRIYLALLILPGPIALEGPWGKGWSIKSAVVEAKRQYVSILSDLVNTREWNKQISNLADIESNTGCLTQRSSRLR